ncbi:BICD family-like cargo adapter 1 [Merluccius polli]|uniref:BICD family-like cargo adapter 1 n=1 Tax=Merluccius polli TaxID=89951 RepID=A0AA47N019_MERPO|nr:BICD family-like cargo adapter 1 [Merluccius polli]
MDRLDQWGCNKSKTMEPEDDDLFFFDYGTEEMPDDQDPADLLAALKQKEEEVMLAARLGNALLLENRQWEERSDALHQQYTDKLEELEQGRHELRLKLTTCQSQWESQVGDLERELRELSGQVERLTQAVGEAEREKGRAQRDHAERTQRLREQLSTAMEVERAMSSELQALKEQLNQARTHSSSQDDELISAMREQVVRLTQREQALEERLASVCQENAELRESLASIHTQLALQDQRNQQQSQQLSEAWGELEEVRSHSHQLQAQVEELQEEVSFQEAQSHGDSSSLLSELETSLDTAELGLSKEQMRQEVSSALQLLLPLTRGMGAPGCSPVAGAQGDLNAVLCQLKDTTQCLAHSGCPQEMNSAFVEGRSDPCGNLSAAQELRDQNAELQQQNAELRRELEHRQQQTEVVLQAIKDRDEAITKKNLMEVELVRSKNDMMSLNNQLLEAIQRKLELSQELEAWQDDIQIIINQQLKAQQQSEQLQKKPPQSNGTSFFRKPSTTPASSPWTGQPASQASEVDQEKTKSPWKQLLRLGNRANDEERHWNTVSHTDSLSGREPVVRESDGWIQTQDPDIPGGPAGVKEPGSLRRSSQDNVLTST